MSLYLGRNKVGVAYKDVNPNVIDNETLEELNNAVGYRVGDFDSRNIPQMIEELKKNYFQTREMDIMPDYHATAWVRPQEWPNLDSLNLQMEGNDFIYMTYDNTSSFAAVALHIEKVTNGTNILVEIGHVSNGVYTPYDIIANVNNNYVRKLDNSIDGDYPVIRITGDIKLCYSYQVTLDGRIQQYRKQPIVERIAWVPHLTNFCTSYSSNAWGVFTLQREKIANGTGTALTSLYYAWAYCRNLEDLDISGLRTLNITSLQYTFIQNLKMREIDLRHFNVEKVTTFASLFENCRNLKIIDLRGWNTLALTNMASMFSSCYSLTEIKGLENLKTNKVTSFASTFLSCLSFKKLDLTNWNTEKLTTLNSTFYNCRKLIEINLSGWDVSKVTNCSSVFYQCYSLKRINLNGWIKTGKLTSIYQIFSGCNSLEKIDLTPFDVTSSCTSICYAFNGCWSLKELNFPEWDLSGISNSNNNGHSVFVNCYSLEKITGISGWRFSFTNSLTNFFQNCYSLKELDIKDWTVNNCTSLAGFFQGCYSLKQLNLSNWNPENCTTLASMFSGCYSLISVGNIGNWDTSKCTTMSGMFRYCYSLKQFPSIQSWDYSNITSLDSIFSECTSLEEIVWNNINIPNCTNVYQLFRYNYNLKKIETKNWTLGSNITYSGSYYMIYGDCWTLRDIDGFIIPSTYTQLGFANCENLSYETVIKIFNALPVTTAGHTIHIPTVVTNMLTAEEKAIATNKNWTIAA